MVAAAQKPFWEIIGGVGLSVCMAAAQKPFWKIIIDIHLVSEGWAKCMCGRCTKGLLVNYYNQLVLEELG